MTHTIKLELDDDREAVLAGSCILEAAASERAWALFWDAVRTARREFHQTQSRAHAEDDRAPALGSEQGALAPRTRPTRGRSRPARVAPLRGSRPAEPRPEAGPDPGRTVP
jgi:hypothetical protein